MPAYKIGIEHSHKAYPKTTVHNSEQLLLINTARYKISEQIARIH